MASEVGKTSIAVVVPVSNAHCRDIVRGIFQYAAENQNWTLRNHPVLTEESLNAISHWNCSGAIVLAGPGPCWGQLMNLGIPVVNASGYDIRHKVPTVTVDNYQVGTQAAEYFLRDGYTSFRYVGLERVKYSVFRGMGFRDRLAEEGFDCPEFFVWNSPKGKTKRHERRTAKWLERLPLHTALLASSDAEALELLQIAAHHGVEVPETLSVLGVDDDDVACFLTNPPLSSVRLPGIKIGFNAANLLAKLLVDPGSTVEDLYIPPEGISVRRSTDSLGVDDEVVRKGVSFIRSHVTKPLLVSDVARSVGVSRRVLEQHFRSTLNRSPRSEIRHQQLARACSLLAHSVESISNIAEGCGFRNASRLNDAFRREHNMTPREYRRLFSDKHANSPPEG